MDASRNTAWPVELRVRADRKALLTSFDDGFAAEIPAEMLRVMSPSAEVQGHTPDERKTVPGKRDVMILGVEPVGNYAIRIRFDDLHDSGIYGWPLLYRFGRDREALFAEYLAELEAKGLSREPRRRA
ncbi:MAG: gamma-butyrobetaine hydroxylase-like domain-containing protein [Rhabdaerophilum sp.]